jgi:hypothetical protein
MAQGATPPNTGVAAGSTATAPATPTTVVVETQKKQKRKTSRGLKDVARLERGVAKAGDRLGSAMEAGFSKYREKSKKSSYKKKDGAIRDAVKNWSVAAGKGLEEASKIPGDITKVLSTKQVSRAVRGVARIIVPPIFR